MSGYVPPQPIGLTSTAAIPSTFDNTGGGGGSSTNKNSQSSPGSAKGKSGSNTNAVSLTARQTESDTNAPAAEAGANSSNPQGVGLQSIAVVPPGPISDGLVPQEFYTYTSSFWPDLTQKYGLRIKGGMGELRATENLVNGWMHTGLGPLYLKDSSTAETLTANRTNGLRHRRNALANCA